MTECLELPFPYDKYPPIGLRFPELLIYYLGGQPAIKERCSHLVYAFDSKERVLKIASEGVNSKEDGQVVYEQYCREAFIVYTDNNNNSVAEPITFCPYCKIRLNWKSREHEVMEIANK